MCYEVKIARWERRYTTVSVEADTPEDAAELLRSNALEGPNVGHWASCNEPADGWPLVHGEAIIEITDHDDQQVCGFVSLTTESSVPDEDLLSSDALQCAVQEAVEDV